MNPFLVSMAIVFSFVVMVSAWMIFPCFNMQIIRSNSGYLKNRVQKIIDNNRKFPVTALEQISSLDLEGLKIKSVDLFEENDYLRYRVVFCFTNLFTNKFFTREDFLDKEVSFDFLIDKV